MLLTRLDPLAFAFAMGVGMMIVYIVAPRPVKVVRFPTPENPGTYRRDDATCYTYSATSVPCTKDAVPIPDPHPGLSK
jgi:hypothetical protein